MLKIWITGSNGQIGTALNELIEPLDIEILNTDKDEIDIADTNEVIRFGEINRLILKNVLMIKIRLLE